MVDYPRLLEREEKLIHIMNGLSKKDENWRKYAMEQESIDYFFEGGANYYKFILRFAQRNGFDEVYDIGCAYGHQSEIFTDSEVKYTGIEQDQHTFWNSDTYKYINKRYPFFLKVLNKDKALAVSVLCVGWNYNYGRINTFQQLYENFDHALLYMPHESVQDAAQFWPNIEVVSSSSFGQFYYLTH